jgi:hypothetical protein
VAITLNYFGLGLLASSIGVGSSESSETNLIHARTLIGVTEIALAGSYEAQGSGVGQVISFHIKPEREHIT